MDTPSTAEQRPNPEQVRWFAEEIHSHDGQLKSYLQRAFPTVRDIDDIVQDSYVRIWKAQGRGPIRSAKAFLFTVARRLALDWIRRDRRSPVVPVKDFDQLFVSDKSEENHAADSALEIRFLAEAISALPRRCQEIFVLCRLESLSQKDVAKRLGISESTVAVQSARGLRRCEEFIRRRMKRG